MTNIITDVVGSLRANNPQQATEIQLKYGLDVISDGQIYTYQKIKDANLPFFLDKTGKPLLPEIELQDDNTHRIVNLLAKLKDPIDANRSMVIDYFEQAFSSLKTKTDKRKLKFILPLPLTLLNVFSFKSVYSVYGKRSRDHLLRDIYNFIFQPLLDYVVSKYSVKYFQGDDPAIFDSDIHGDLLDEEFKLIGEIQKASQDNEIMFGLYTPEVPLPTGMDSQKVLQEVYSFEKAMPWMFISEEDSSEEIGKKIRFVKRVRKPGLALALGLLESNRDSKEDVKVLVAKVEQILSDLELAELHLTPRGGFKGIDISVAERKFELLTKIKELL